MTKGLICNSTLILFGSYATQEGFVGAHVEKKGCHLAACSFGWWLMAGAGLF
jgi:hypothetical protein